MKNRLLPLLFVLGGFSAYSQVGIGKLDPSPSAQLEVFATDKGMLIPRVKLTSSTDATTIGKGNVESLLVFNTNAISDIKPGYYYWFDNKWNRILISGESSGAAGSVTYNPTTNVFSYTDAAGNTQLVDISEMIKANETLTILENKGEGVYVYTNEKGDAVTINVVGDVVANASTIFNNTEVTNFIKEISEQTSGSVTYNSETKQFSYVDVAGNTQVVNIADVIKGSETVTTLENKGEGLYTYKNEEGTEVNIDVVGDVVANASTIINNSEFKTELTNVIKTDETLTSLENKGEGLYTYTNEKGVEVDINVVGDVIGNASTIFNNAEVTNFIKEISEQAAGSVTYNSETKQFSYVDVAGNTQVVNIADVIKGSETVTTLENKGEGLYTYKNEEGTEVNIDVVGDVVANASTIINNSEFKTELTNVIKTDETLTTLENKGEGLYTYTNEKGVEVDINVVGDVVANASTIFNNAEVTNFIKEISEQTAGSVTYNSETKQFSYVDVAGNTQVVNIADVIKGSETVTTLENKGEGLYTYKNEEGTEVNIDVVGDVVANASTIINNSEFKTELTNVIKTDETLTTLENKGSGLYTYTNEKGVEVDINVVGDVVANASTIFNNAEVTNFIKEISEQTAGSVTYNSETKQFSYVDVAGNTQVVNIADVIKGSETVTTLENKGEGLYTYKNEEGTEVNIDVVGDVVANASTIINNSEFKTELTNVIKTDETLTTLENKGEGLYTYTNEKGVEVDINVVGDVVANASTIFNNPEVTNFIKEISEQTAGSVTYNSETKQFSYVDVAGNTQVVNIADVIKGSETVTTLENKGEGLYTYKNEEGTEVNIDVVGDVVANASTIINNSEFKTELTNVIKTDETLTTLENKGEGLYTYTNEKGVEVDINVVGDVIGNASTIFNNAEVTNFIKEISEQTAGSVTYNSETKQFSYVDVAGNTQVVNIADVIKGSETVTTLENKGEGLYTYKNEEGTEVNIDVVGDVVANASTIINNSEFKTGITEIIKTDETLTTLDSKGEGVYVYTNEKGDAVTIDVVGDVVANASTIFNNPEVTNFIKEISDQTAGSVTYNSETKQFSYVDVAGNTQVVNIADVIKGSETVTTLTNNGSGSYTYVNEAGAPSDINVVSDVISNASTIFNNTDVVNELTKIVDSKETITTLVHNTTAKTLVYNGEGEQSTTINLADITTSTPDTVLAVSGTGSTFTAATVNVVPSTVVGDVITTTAEGVVGWKAAAKNNVMGIKVISANYTVGNDDYTIIARKLTQDITITLPDAKTNTGRLLVINQYNVIIPNTNPDIQVPVKVNFNTDVVYSDAASYPYMTASMFGGVTNGSIKMTLQSDGENWYVITYTM